MVPTASPADTLASLRITVTSPDRSVTARICAEAGFAIDFDAERLYRHDDASLSQQLTAAVKDAQSGFGTAFAAVLDDMREADAPRAAPRPQAAIRRRIRQATREVVTTGWSRQGRVRVRFAGDGRLKISLTPGTVAHLRGEVRELAAEVVEADGDARRRYREAVAEIRRTHADHIRQ